MSDPTPGDSFSFHPEILTDLNLTRIQSLDRQYLESHFVKILECDLFIAPKRAQDRVDTLESNMETAMNLYEKYNTLRRITRNELVRKKKLIRIKMTFSDYLDTCANVPKGEHTQAEHLARILNLGVESRNELYIQNVVEACVSAGYLSRKPRFQTTRIKLY